MLQDCNSASFFALLAGEATHSGMREQISICVRFVHIKEGENKVEVREDFLWLVEAESTKRVALAEKFMNTLNEFGIDIHKMRAQGYDGAANMSGVHKRSTQEEYGPSYGNRYQRQCTAIVRRTPLILPLVMLVGSP